MKDRYWCAKIDGSKTWKSAKKICATTPPRVLLVETSLIFYFTGITYRNLKQSLDLVHMQYFGLCRASNFEKNKKMQFEKRFFGCSSNTGSGKTSKVFFLNAAHLCDFENIALLGSKINSWFLRCKKRLTML